jgi:DNA polymerase-1
MSESVAPKTLLLVDGSSYLYRAFHAMPDLRAVPGDPTSPATGAIRGMINMMQKLRKDVRADYAACVFDAKGPTFRDALYPQYKANRSPMPDDLRSQIPPIHEVVKLLGWQVLDVPGVEADDVIGTLAHTASQQGITVIISSGDKDLSQLVNEHITVIDTMNDRRRDMAGVEAEFGVPPRLMLDYQTLVGDTVDNVPGVPKVGPKTAVKWLLEYGSLDALVARAGEIKGVAGENLRNALGWLPKGRELLTIKTDCDLADHVQGLPALDAITIGGQDSEALKAFSEKYGFKGLVRTLEAQETPPELIEEQQATRRGETGGLFDEPAIQINREATNLKYDTIFTWDALDTWLARLMAADLAAVDTETTSLDEMRAEIVGVSFSVTPGEAAYIPLMHNYPDAPDQLPRDEVLARLKPWLEDGTKKKLGQHVKYDRHVFANHGIEVQGYAHDTMLQSYVLEVHKPHGLASLAERHLGRSGINYEDLCGKGAHQIPFSQVDVAKAAEYSCEDSDQTLDVHRTLWPQLEKDDKLRFVYELEMASSETLYRIERNGVLIDAPTLAAQSHELGQRIMALEAQAHELAGQPFNLGSPKQIGEIFFTKLGLPVVKKTPSGAPSTDEEVLEKLAEDYPLPARILEHRGLSKLKGTYTDKLAQLAHPRTGRVHTHYAQAVAVTGRLSSNDPNLQNIPIRTPEGRRVREAFVAPHGQCDCQRRLQPDRAAHHGAHQRRRSLAQGLSRGHGRAPRHGGRGVWRAHRPGVQRAAPLCQGHQLRADLRHECLWPGARAGHRQHGGQELHRALLPALCGRQDLHGRDPHDGQKPGLCGNRVWPPPVPARDQFTQRPAPRRRRARGHQRPHAGHGGRPHQAQHERGAAGAGRREARHQMIMQVHDELVFEVPEGEVDWLQNRDPASDGGGGSAQGALAGRGGRGPELGQGALTFAWDKAH